MEYGRGETKERGRRVDSLERYFTGFACRRTLIIFVPSGMGQPHIKSVERWFRGLGGKEKGELENETCNKVSF